MQQQQLGLLWITPVQQVVTTTAQLKKLAAGRMTRRVGQLLAFDLQIDLDDQIVGEFFKIALQLRHILAGAGFQLGRGVEHDFRRHGGRCGV